MTSEQRWNNWRVAPYTRLQFIDAQLDAFWRNGRPDMGAVLRQRLDARNLRRRRDFVVGYDFVTNWGVLTPTLRAEYTRAFNSNLTQGLSYADTPGVNYAFTVAGLGPNTLSGALGLAAHSRTGAAALFRISILDRWLIRPVAGTARHPQFSLLGAVSANVWIAAGARNRATGPWRYALIHGSRGGAGRQK